MQARRWRVLAATGLAVVLTLSTWFSATAVAVEMGEDLGLKSSQLGWLTSAVQAGFVVGALCLSLFALTDVWPIRALLAVGAGVTGLANAALLAEPGVVAALAARFATGVALAMVYPTALKLIGTWFATGRGLAMGAVVGALTLGSASPHLIRAAGIGLDWRIVILGTSLACLVAAGLFLSLSEGPHRFTRARFEWGQLRKVLRNRPGMLANFGYFGHMWELYAMWGWLLAYVTAAQAKGLNIQNASLLTFAAIAVGAFGCLAGGVMADRFGRCLTASLAMAVSGLCALLVGFVYDGPPVLFVAVVMVWGVSAVADSAQFSAAVSEVSDPALVGTSLAFQMGAGFAITIVAISVVHWIAEAAGDWRWAFSVLSVGPALGIWAMLSLRSHPAADRIANGRR